MSDEAAGDQLLDAALRHVPFDGWSAAALAAGARDCGVDDDALRAAFPDGVAGALTRFSRRADGAMVAALAAAETAEMRLRDRVAFAVEARLAALAPHREAVRRGLSWLALPQNAALGVRLMYRTVDDIWYAVGDRSADFSFYTKRALLAGVVASTTLYWLDDRSGDGAATRGFLARRIADVLRIGSLGRRGRAAGSAARAAGRGAVSPLRVLRDVLKERYGADATQGLRPNAGDRPADADADAGGRPETGGSAEAGATTANAAKAGATKTGATAG